MRRYPLRFAGFAGFAESVAFGGCERNPATVSESRLRRLAAIGLVVGAVLGMAGTFTTSASWRGLTWGVDGVALIVEGALLTVQPLFAYPFFAATLFG